jgi:predicted acyltransferase
MTTMTTAPTPTRRLLSLDLLRGLTIMFMIIVNDNGDERSAWGFLKHADWTGWTWTDMVFPSFMLIAGISLSLSIGSRLAKGVSRGTLALSLARRCLMLLVLGLLVNGLPYMHLATLRYPGVLQRFAVCLFIVGMLLLFIRKTRWYVLMTAAVLLAYWYLMTRVAVPGFGVPIEHPPILNRFWNLESWLDRRVFGIHIYIPGHEEPEGLLSTLPSLATTMIGVMTARWIGSQYTRMQKACGLLAAGVVSFASGTVWGFWFPISKKLWTSSFVLLAAGVTLMFFAAFFFAVDVYGKAKDGQVENASANPWGPAVILQIFGLNSIVAYVFSEFLAIAMGQRYGMARSVHSTAYHALANVIPNPGWASFTFALLYLCVCFIPVWVLWRKRIYLKL